MDQEGFFPNGPNPVKHSEETEFNIEYLIGEIESNYQEDHMPSYCHYTTNCNQCIHCKGHMLLRIITYLLEFMLCLSNPGDISLSTHQETKATSDINLNSSNNYKTKGQLLPSQQSAFLHAQATMTYNPAYNVLAFSARKQLIKIHQQLSDILH